MQRAGSLPYLNRLYSSPSNSISIFCFYFDWFVVFGLILDADGRSDDSYVSKDALEGDTIQLECKFDPTLIKDNTNQYIFYWHRKNHQKTEPVAIGGSSLEFDYKVNFNMMLGIFNLRIDRAQYDRDNGQFECKIKESGTGTEIKSRVYIVTILSKSII